MKDVEGKVAFITGGSSGVGLGIARAFADAGMKIAIGYRTRQHRDLAMDALSSARSRVLDISVDVADRAGMEKAAAETVLKFGKLHVLVNNAGVYSGARLTEMKEDDWDWIIGVNVNGMFNGLRACFPHIKAHGEGGHIIATSSILGLFATDTGGAYAATKFAVVGFMESLRNELAAKNIGVSVFCPGPVASDILDSERNHPKRSRDERAERDATSGRSARRNAADIMSPLEAGNLVLRGMQMNDPYILTHGEYAQIIRERTDALLAAIDEDSQPTDERLRIARSYADTTSYVKDKEGMQCARGVGTDRLK